MSRGGGRESLQMSGGRGSIFSLPSPLLRGRGPFLSGSPKSAESVESSSKATAESLSKDSNDDLQNFNPMKEAFDDPAFNSYTDFAPGTLLDVSQQVDSRKGKGAFKLHVSNIPNSMSKGAIENIFNLYGDTVDVYMARSQGPTTWAFVKYESLQAALNAIASLDRQHPHNLKVKFAKGGHKKDPQDIETPVITVKTSDCDQKVFPLYGIHPRKLQPSRSHYDRNALESNGYHTSHFSNYIPPAQVKVNNTVMEHYTTTVHNGVMVKGGRGYTPHQAPPEHPKGQFETPIHKDDLPAFKLGNCINCQAITSTGCHVCEAWYCSNACKENDYDKHKLVCRPRATIIQSQDDFPAFKLGNCINCQAMTPSGCRVCKAWYCSHTCMKNDYDKHKFVCRPRATTIGLDGTIHYHLSQTKIDYTKHPPVPRDDGYVLTQSGLVSDRLAKSEANIHKRDFPGDSHVKRDSQPGKSAPEPPIPRGTFSECLIRYNAPNDDWCSVMPASMAAEHDEMLDDLAEYFCQTRPNATDISTGALCGAQFDDDNLWYRAEITAFTKKTGLAQILFIDFGNEAEVPAKDLKALPNKLLETPPMAFRIFFVGEKKPVQLNDIVKISPIKQTLCGSWLVRTEDDPEPPEEAATEELRGQVKEEDALPSELTNPKKPNHVLSLLTPKSDAFIAVTKATGEDYFSGYLQIVKGPHPYRSMDEISKTLGTTKLNPSFKPAVNDDVIATINKDSRLYRGYVMCVEETPRVALIDLGCVETPCKLAALPPEFKDIPPSGVSVSLHQPTSSLLSALLGSEFTLENIKITGEEVTADIGSYGQATITPWVPLLEEAHIPVFKLDNQSQAVVTAFHSPQAIYVRPLTPDCIEVYCTVVQDICAFCVFAKPLKKPPRLGELVCARSNIDSYFHRALISETEKNSFKVIFLDIGNVETVALDDLRSLPDHIKKVPATVVKIGLKDVPGQLFNKNATKMMMQLVARETKVIVTHDGDLRNVVLAEESSGDVVNKILAQAMMPSWAKNPSNLLTDPPYMNTDVRPIEWNKGDKLVGTVVGSASYCEFLFVHHSIFFEYIHAVLTPQMNKYCEELQETSYKPRPHEFVMAKFDGDWYRAVCTSAPSTFSNSTANVFFIDYGNVGEMHIKDMRKMIPEFGHIHAAVKYCKIYGLPSSESISAENKKKLTDALVALVNVELIVVKPEGGSTVVWIPALEDTLAALGISYTRP